jgi:hypothetical protein
MSDRCLTWPPCLRAAFLGLWVLGRRSLEKMKRLRISSCTEPGFPAQLRHQLDHSRQVVPCCLQVPWAYGDMGSRLWWLVKDCVT